MIQNALEENNMDKAIVYKCVERKRRNGESRQSAETLKAHKQSTKLKASQIKFPGLIS